MARLSAKKTAVKSSLKKTSLRLKPTNRGGLRKGTAGKKPRFALTSRAKKKSKQSKVSGTTADLAHSGEEVSVYDADEVLQNDFVYNARGEHLESSLPCFCPSCFCNLKIYYHLPFNNVFRSNIQPVTVWTKVCS